jgi:hypothetical protein
MSIVEFSSAAIELVRLNKDAARLLKESVRTGIESVLAVAGLPRESTPSIMFSGAGLVILTGL